MLLSTDTGNDGTNRTLKLQEPRKLGYGVRCEKHKAKTASKPSVESAHLQPPAYGRSKFDSLYFDVYCY